MKECLTVEMVRRKTENEVSEKETVHDRLDEINWEVDSKDRVKHNETICPAGDFRGGNNCWERG